MSLTNCGEREQVEGCADEKEGLGFQKETGYTGGAAEGGRAAPSN